MKNTKVFKLNFVNYKTNKGMVMFEFMIVLFLSLMSLFIFIELGYILKSETVVMAITKQAAREINVKGCLDIDTRNAIVQRLKANNLTVTEILFSVEGRPYKKLALDDTFTTEQVLFRQDYNVAVWVSHRLRALTFGRLYDIKIPLVFQQNGRGEVWTTDSLKETY